MSDKYIYNFYVFCVCFLCGLVELSKLSCSFCFVDNLIRGQQLPHISELLRGLLLWPWNHISIFFLQKVRQKLRPRCPLQYYYLAQSFHSTKGDFFQFSRSTLIHGIRIFWWQFVFRLYILACLSLVFLWNVIRTFFFINSISFLVPFSLLR